jgi:hypothetical protein
MRLCFVLDDSTRHHSKRSSAKSFVDSYKNFQVPKVLLLRMGDDLKSSSDEEEKIIYLKKWRKNIKSIDKKLSDILIDVREK